MPSIPSVYRFCPYCAGDLSRARGEEQMQVCARCGIPLFHAAKPATSAIVLRRSDWHVLFIKRGNAPYKGKWDFPGGFINYRESVEAATLREVREECGLEVKLVRNLGATPHQYPRPQGVDQILCHCYLVEPIGGETRAGDDAAAFRWFPIGEPPKNAAWPWFRRDLLRRVMEEEQAIR